MVQQAQRPFSTWQLAGGLLVVQGRSLRKFIFICIFICCRGGTRVAELFVFGAASAAWRAIQDEQSEPGGLAFLRRGRTVAGYHHNDDRGLSARTD